MWLTPSSGTNRVEPLSAPTVDGATSEAGQPLHSLIANNGAGHSGQKPPSTFAVRLFAGLSGVTWPSRFLGEGCT